jgi:hypothetical protein
VRRRRRLSRVYAQLFEPYIVRAPLRRPLHLVAQAVSIRDEPRMQFRRSRQDNPYGKEPSSRRLDMRAHSCLNRAKKVGFINVRRGVNEDLRPARIVRHNAPNLRDNPVCDLHNDRASCSAFSDTAALEIAGIYDPWIPRDDFEGVNVAERPIVIPARCERSAAVQGA